MSYEYYVHSQGVSSWSFIEAHANVLQELLNGEAIRELERAGWELFQVNTLNDKQGNNGFFLVFRRPLQQP